MDRVLVVVESGWGVYVCLTTHLPSNLPMYRPTYLPTNLVGLGFTVVLVWWYDGGVPRFYGTFRPMFTKDVYNQFRSPPVSDT